MLKQMLMRDWVYMGQENVELPHTVAELPFHYFDESQYQMDSVYERVIHADKDWLGKLVKITFEGVAHHAKVFLNGTQVYEHACGYTAFCVDITENLRYAEDNLLRVEVSSWEDLHQPPFGNVIDYMTYGGIYRDVYLTVCERVHIQDLFVSCIRLSGEDATIEVALTASEELQGERIRYELYDAQEILHSSWEDMTSKKQFTVHGISPWSVDKPTLYTLKASIAKDLSYPVEQDVCSVRFGFRTAQFRADGFYLNGERLELLGLNRHQSYPYVGYAMPKRPQQTDAEILKYELGCNVVRTSHYPQSHYFLDRCDEIGLLVVTEIPGWQHIGDEAWKEIACQNTREMVLQYRNHPSIILWGVRINESPDDESFYQRTNAIARECDPYRATGGVRNFAHSQLLEDVYTYNDFTNHGQGVGVTLRKKVSAHPEKAYLITEYNGHMYPTKSHDDESHRRDHALYHAQVIEDVRKQKDVAGCIGWCMTDYNTHRDFGSGDRICYHGVMDMFRNPKPAAYVYASQKQDDYFLHVASTMDIGEHPSGNIGSIYLFTNYDSVRLYKNDVFVKEFTPDKKRFGNMLHPPIIVDDPVGELMERQEGYSHQKAEAIKEVLQAVLRYGQDTLPLKYKLKLLVTMLRYQLKPADGYRLFYEYIGNWGGKVVRYRFEGLLEGEIREVVIKEPVTKITLCVQADTNELYHGDTYDVASIRIRAVDQNGNLLPYFGEAVEYEVEGDIALIGPSVSSFKGGMTGTYVRSKSRDTSAARQGTLRIRTRGIQEEIQFVVKQ